MVFERIQAFDGHVKEILHRSKRNHMRQNDGEQIAAEVHQLVERRLGE